MRGRLEVGFPSTRPFTNTTTTKPRIHLADHHNTHVSLSCRPLTEASIAAKLEEFRAKQPQFVSLSFATISAVDANGE